PRPPLLRPLALRRRPTAGGVTSGPICDSPKAAIRMDIPPETLGRIEQEIANKNPKRILPQVERQRRREAGRLRAEIAFALFGACMILTGVFTHLHHWALYTLGAFFILIGTLNAIAASRERHFQTLKAAHLQTKIADLDPSPHN
ncbi:MAG: hypothetical protein KDK99_19640, partial [Verrucomicrobiales bacterium]|nr:hypothetical protein [Verrucomicrobiales bacterium]